MKALNCYGASGYPETPFPLLFRMKCSMVFPYERRSNQKKKKGMFPDLCTRAFVSIRTDLCFREKLSVEKGLRVLGVWCLLGCASLSNGSGNFSHQSPAPSFWNLSIRSCFCGRPCRVFFLGARKSVLECVNMRRRVIGCLGFGDLVRTQTVDWGAWPREMGVIMEYGHHYGIWSYLWNMGTIVEFGHHCGIWA